MFSSFNSFMESITAAVASTACFNNTRLLPREEFQEELRNLNQSIDRNLNNDDIDMENDTNSVASTVSEQSNYQEHQNINIFNGNSAILYVRASTKEQNIEAQQHACVEFCRKYKLRIKKTYIEKCSAYKTNSQPELNNLINQNNNTNLIIFSVDRFSRNVKKSDEYIKKLENKNIILISLKENINLSTAFGKHTFRTYVNASQYESELISERVKNSIKYRKANKIHIGQTPYGYKRNENKKLVKDTQEQAIINFIMVNINRNANSHHLTAELYKLLRSRNAQTTDYVPIQFTEEDNTYEYYKYSGSDQIKISAQILCEVLNDYNIKKRNKFWTKSSVMNIAKNANLRSFQNLRI